MAKNTFCEVTVTFDHQIQLIFESKWTFFKFGTNLKKSFKAFLRYRIHKNGTDGQLENIAGTEAQKTYSLRRGNGETEM